MGRFYRRIQELPPEEDGYYGTGVDNPGICLAGTLRPSIELHARMMKSQNGQHRDTASCGGKSGYSVIEGAFGVTG